MPDEVMSRLGAKFAGHFRSGQKIQAIATLRQEDQVSLAEAKSFMNHVSSGPGLCHRCKAKLPDGEVIECTQCKALNIFS